MNRTLGIRNAQAAHKAQFNRSIPIDILERSISRTWTVAGYSESSRWNLDGESAISGDDLARINAFEPMIMPRLWSDVRRDTGRAAA